MNTGNGETLAFDDVSDGIGMPNNGGRSVSFADYDGDGDLDIYLGQNPFP